jgi:hypothetical protein
MSDQTLSFLNLLLQWVAVIGSVCVLVSAVGLIFARKEISARQALALKAASEDATTAKSLAGSLGAEVERVKRFSYVAMLTINGSPSLGGDITVHTPISRAVEGVWVKVAPDKYRPVCDDAALTKARDAISAFPEFPFSYYALAFCLHKSGDVSWRSYADQAIKIFETTTQINGHQDSHDQCLRVLRELVSGQ